MERSGRQTLQEIEHALARTAEAHAFGRRHDRAVYEHRVGEHGFDPERREMHGIFFARGPAIREAWVAPSFKNIHVYPLMCRILGIGIPTDIDGKAEVLAPVLRR